MQEAYLNGRKKEAIAAIPTELVDEVAFVGPPARIRDQIAKWEDTVVGTCWFSRRHRLATTTCRGCVLPRALLQRGIWAPKARS
ncbi:hypothetical protein [Rhodococcoides fascians]|uniref:hypothetical protein n=1 Tax=Rhodococcoides fascians TaxID=1828 RepID=UPI000561C413|nr:hypothetical protein [Rhodococcus fascians]